MNTLKGYFYLTRPINILIVFITQMLIYHFVINNNISEVSLSIAEQILLGIATALVAASGYVVNDIYDEEIDKINKPDKLIVNKIIPLDKVWIFYYSLIIIGFLLSLLIAINTDNLKLLILYPFGCGLLYLYAKYLKKEGLLGNITVSFMIFFVCGLIIIAERKVLFTIDNYRYLFLITAFGVFSFFLNLLREIVKDIEDIDGDKLVKSKSLPIVMGIERTKFIAHFNNVILIVLCFYFTQMYPHTYRTYFFNFLMILSPCVIVLIRLTKAKEKYEFNAVSKILKTIMAFGLIYLIILSYV